MRSPLPPAIARHVELLLSASRGPGLLKHPSFALVAEWLAEEAEPGILDTDEFFLGVDLRSLQRYHGPLSDEILRSEWGLDPEEFVTNDQRLEFLATAAKWCFSGCRGEDHLPVFQVRPISAVSGQSAVLGYGLTGYSFSMIELEWFGVFQDLENFRANLGAQGWITSSEEFEPLLPSVPLALWDGLSG